MRVDGLLFGKQTEPQFEDMSFGIYQLYNFIQPGFRRQRVELFLKTLGPDVATKILDVGGFPDDWRSVPIESPITTLNLHYKTAAAPKRFTQEIGDGRNLSYADQSFDIAYSNSVIEHLYTFEDQKRFASEMRRVGRRVFVQTPNRWFFIEPHFITVFIHYLPAKLARKLICRLSFRGLFRHGDNVELEKAAAELRLLSFREMKKLFPDCTIHREKWLGMTKSFIAIS